MVASLRYVTQLTGPDSSPPPGNASWTCNTSGLTSFGIVRAHQHNMARPTAYAARCSSVQHTASYHGPEVSYSSPQATGLSRELFGSTNSALPPSLLGCTFFTRPAMDYGARRDRRSRLTERLFEQLLHRLVPRRPGPDQDRPFTVFLNYRTERYLWILAPLASSNRGNGSWGVTEPRCAPWSLCCPP